MRWYINTFSLFAGETVEMILKGNAVGFRSLGVKGILVGSNSISLTSGYRFVIHTHCLLAEKR
jgi:hypothetical protein